jgi:replication factor C subunit 3/5
LDQIDSRIQWIAEQENVQLTEDGKQALLRLSNGDMRRVLNIMQATNVASGVVSEETVYMCTGTPLPKDIERIVTWLLAEDFAIAHQCRRLCLT